MSEAFHGGGEGVRAAKRRIDREAAEAAAAANAAQEAKLNTNMTVQVPTRDQSSAPASSRLPGAFEEDDVLGRRRGATRERSYARKALLGE